MRWTEADLKKLRHAIAEDKAPPAKPRKAYRSQLEAEYAGVLEIRKRAGEISDYGYERLKLRLPGDIWYCPDFDVLRPDGGVELIETKGWMREVARDRLRSAIEAYPGFEWFIVGTGQTARRMLTPKDVPSGRSVVR